MEYIKLETDHVAGLLGLVRRSVAGDGVRRLRRHEGGGEGRAGAATSWRARRWRSRDAARWRLSGQHLHEEGAKLIVTDIDAGEGEAGGRRRSARTAVAPDAIYDQTADVFAPCALGATVNDDTLPRLKVEIIAGGANNQLAEDRHGDLLEQRGILYAPDYVINGGGVINVYGELTAGRPSGRRRRRARSTTPCSGSSRSPSGRRSRPTGGRPPGRAAHRGGGRAGSDVDGGRRCSGGSVTRPTQPPVAPAPHSHTLEPDGRSDSHRRRSRRLRS